MVTSQHFANLYLINVICFTDVHVCLYNVIGMAQIPSLKADSVSIHHAHAQPTCHDIINVTNQDLSLNATDQ